MKIALIVYRNKMSTYPLKYVPLDNNSFKYLLNKSKGIQRFDLLNLIDFAREVTVLDNRDNLLAGN
jgi:hypothetical protein